MEGCKEQASPPSSEGYVYTGLKATSGWFLHQGIVYGVNEQATFQDLLLYVFPTGLCKAPPMGRKALEREERTERRQDKLVVIHTINWVDEPQVPVELEKEGPKAKTQPKSVFYDFLFLLSL